MPFDITKTDLTNPGKPASNFFALGDVVSFFGDFLLTTVYRAITILHTSPEELMESKGGSIFKYGVNSLSISDINKILEDETKSHVLCVVPVVGSASRSDAALMESIRPGKYEEVVAAGVYLSQALPTRAFIHRQNKNIILAVNHASGGTAVWSRLVASALIKLMPYYFPDVNDDDKKFFRLLAEGKGEEIEAAVIAKAEEALKAVDFGAMHLKSMLHGIGDAARQREEEAAAQAIQSLRSRIQESNDLLSDYYKSLAAQTARFDALRNAPKDGDDKYIKFFTDHMHNVTVVNVTAGSIHYEVHDVLEFFSSDVLRSYMEDPDTVISSCLKSSNSFRKAFYQVFVDRVASVAICSKFTLNAGGLVSPVSGFGYPVTEAPNPHLFYHGCSGENDLYYSQFAEEGSWDLAIEQSISATKNLNIEDSTVMEEFIDWLQTHRDAKILIKGDERISFNTLIKNIEEGENRDG